MLGSTNPVVGDSFDGQEYLKSYQELKKSEDTRAGEKVIKYEGDEKVESVSFRTDSVPLMEHEDIYAVLSKSDETIQAVSISGEVKISANISGLKLAVVAGFLIEELEDRYEPVNTVEFIAENEYNFLTSGM